jgi:hypothetical protein
VGNKELAEIILKTFIDKNIILDDKIIYIENINELKNKAIIYSAINNLIKLLWSQLINNNNVFEKYFQRIHDQLSSLLIFIDKNDHKTAIYIRYSIEGIMELEEKYKKNHNTLSFIIFLFHRLSLIKKVEFDTFFNLTQQYTEKKISNESYQNSIQEEFQNYVKKEYIKNFSINNELSFKKSNISKTESNFDKTLENLIKKQMIAMKIR